MPYKVFLVEDEIVAREGIRDNVDWTSMGFEFCGEASDGEIALPQIEAVQPDVLITDIKMPFMDGLELCRLVRERMPRVKIIILSGHDEFNYAQEAVKLGVTEYLLKPIGVKDFHNVLQKVAAQLDQEQQKQTDLQQLKAQVEDNQTVLREQFLLRLVTGSFSLAEAVEQSHRLGIDIIAPCYLVLVIKIALRDATEQFNYLAYREVRWLVSGLLANNPDVFLVKKDIEELVMIIKDSRPDTLAREADFLAGIISNEVAQKTQCRLTVGIGEVKNRLSDIQHSFTEAQVDLKGAALTQQVDATANQADKAELLKLDKPALEKFLTFGNLDEFNGFFEAYLNPLSQAALGSYLIKNYIFVDFILTTARFVHKLGGNADQIIPEINNIETLLMHIKTVEQIKTETRKIFAGALAFRDGQNQSVLAVNKAKEFINNNYTNPDLSLSEVANYVNLSGNHLSTLFSQETEQTFKEYITSVRIDKAKELLKTTSLKSVEIADRVGYNDPHYFSTVFKKTTGFSPSRFKVHGDQKPLDNPKQSSGGAP